MLLSAVNPVLGAARDRRRADGAAQVLPRLPSRRPTIIGLGRSRGKPSFRSARASKRRSSGSSSTEQRLNPPGVPALRAEPRSTESRVAHGRRPSSPAQHLTAARTIPLQSAPGWPSRQARSSGRSTEAPTRRCCPPSTHRAVTGRPNDRGSRSSLLRPACARPIRHRPRAARVVARGRSHRGLGVAAGARGARSAPCIVALKQTGRGEDGARTPAHGP